MSTRRQILDSLADYLAFEIDEGRTRIECTPETAAVLRGAGARRQSARVTAPQARQAPVLTQSGAGAPPPAAAPEKSRRPRSDVLACLDAVAAKARACESCDLHKERKQAVPGQGNPAPEILFVGEAPGADEDEQGLAFVGAAGQLLTQMITAMGYTREQVFIANVAKCRPPGNRQPLPEEMAACLPYLKEQIRLLRPAVIVALGATAVKGLLNPTESITRLRGKWQSFEGIPLMPTFHPAYLLYNPASKRDVWTDLKEVLARLGRQPPPKTGKRTDQP
jgi:DNA polymerase